MLIHLYLPPVIKKIKFFGMQRLFIIAFTLGVFTQFSTLANNGDGTEPAGPKDTEQAHASRPDFPGYLIINLGSSYLTDAPEGMAIKALGSRPFDVYYSPASLDIPRLKLSFVPAIGFGFDRLSFQKAVTIDYNATGDLILDSLDDAHRSKFVTNYVDVPLELRFIPKFDSKEKSAWVAVGGLVGYNFETHTKLKYMEDDQLKMTKQREDFNVNKIRYSVHARLGFGGFSLYYKLGLSELFESGKGPNGFSPTVNTFGISFTGF